MSTVSKPEQQAAEPDAVTVALALVSNLDPKNGVPYGWVADVAKGRLDALMKAFEDLDAKAGAIVGYLGGGTGLATLGTLFTVLNSSVRVEVAGLTIPAIIASGCSLLFAAWARGTKEVYPAPDAGTLIEVADSFAADGEKGAEKAKAVLAAYWDLCTARMRPVIAWKGQLVDISTRCFVIAVFLLSLPLFAALNLPKEATKPQDVNVTITTPAPLVQLSDGR